MRQELELTEQVLQLRMQMLPLNESVMVNSILGAYRTNAASAAPA